MNREDVAGFFGLIDTYSPGFASKDRVRGLAAVWLTQLQDVDAAIATDAVHAHYARETRWIMIADIRRHVADALGLLPPDVDTAFAQATMFNRWLSRRRGTEPPIHPAAIEAARLIGWSAFDTADGGYRRFRDAYRTIAEKETQRTLTGNLAELTTAVNAPKALPAGSGVVRDQPEPDVSVERVAAVRAAVARTSAAWAPKPPRADYLPPTDVEKDRWSAALSEWAERNGKPIEREVS